MEARRSVPAAASQLDDPAQGDTTAARSTEARVSHDATPTLAPARKPPLGITPVRLSDRLRFQVPIALLVTVLLPALIRQRGDIDALRESVVSMNTLGGTAIAVLLGLYLYRRFTGFPGVQGLGYVIPSFLASYGLLVATFFFLRLEYNRFQFLSSFLLASLLFFTLSVRSPSRGGARFYVIPTGDTAKVADIPFGEWEFLREPVMPPDPAPVLVADLRADLGDDWERLIARAALAGHPVYHVKQLRESLTGRVEIEHLSENSFGSLLPNHAYNKVKRLFDLAAAILALPIAIPVMAVAAMLIKLDSPGQVFFRQERMGYRGRPFRVIKFRTMRSRVVEDCESQLRFDAITLSDDDRITRVGRFLRRTRIDELPQILNVIRGDMSWIGPRPEALALSRWYQAELPFYDYRHIVRPGISGWAQVSQGHVAELNDVRQKLHYDFYYIKNFSAWLDLLIAFRTVQIVLTGSGAK